MTEDERAIEMAHSRALEAAGRGHKEAARAAAPFAANEREYRRRYWNAFDRVFLPADRVRWQAIRQVRARQFGA